MATRVKVKKSLRRLFSYGSHLFDQSKRDGPTVPMFTSVCPTCGAERQHTNKEQVQYCYGCVKESDWKRHPSVRKTWKGN